jgi:hypothetical protein
MENTISLMAAGRTEDGGRRPEGGFLSSVIWLLTSGFDGGGFDMLFNYRLQP